MFGPAVPVNESYRQEMKQFTYAMFFAGLLLAPVFSAAQTPATAQPLAPAQPVPSSPATASPGMLNPAAQPPSQSPLAASTGTSTTGAPAPPLPGSNSARYIIGSTDAIQVSVWKEPGLSGSFPVRPDGMISLSLVGDIEAAGRTPMDLANDLTERLKKFIQDPNVTVTVVAVNSKHVYLIGEISRIGPIPLTSDLTPLQAISAAGGLTPYANKKHIYILRGEQGKQKKIPFDYKKAVKDGDQQGVVLLPGDTIVVP